MIILLGEASNELELERKINMLCDKIDYGNLIVYQVGEKYLACNIEPNMFTTN